MSADEKNEFGQISRRDFLRLGWANGVVRGAEAVERALGQTKKKAEGPVRLGPVERFRSLPVGTVQPGPPGSRLYVVRIEKGLLALSTRCPGDGYPVARRPQDPSEDSLAPHGRFYCPADASIFDRHGRLRAGPAPRDLDIVTLRVNEGILWADPAALLVRTDGDETAGILPLESPAK